jgi:hypothetical protein
MAVTGVQATLTGPVSGTMSCEPNGSAILCQWPLGVVVTQGTYSLEVSAPGYQTTTVQSAGHHLRVDVRLYRIVHPAGHRDAVMRRIAIIVPTPYRL